MGFGSRVFAANSDVITFPLAGAAVTSAFTLAALVRPNPGNTQSVFIEDSGRNVELYRETDGLVGWSGAGSKATTAIPLDGQWQVVAACKAAGSATPRLHRVLIGGSAVHADGDSVLANAAAVTNWTLGYFNGSSYGFKGCMAAAGVWKSVLSDAQVEALGTEAGWGSADAWWSERDGFATDRASGLARLSMTGTSHSTEEPAGFWVTSRKSGGLVFDDSGALMTTTNTTGAQFSGGFLRAPSGALVVSYL